MVTLILYTRPDCHLCDVAKDALREAAEVVSFAIEERDVDTNPAWAAAFGDDVPVGVIGGRKVFKHRVEPHRLVVALEARGARPEASSLPSG